MDAINTYITDLLGPLGPLFVVGGLGLLLVLLAVPAILFQKKDPLSKLKESQNDRHAGVPKGLRVGGKNEKLDKFKQFLEPQNQEEYGAVQLMLIRAGYRSKGAVQTFHFAQFALGMGFLALGVIYTFIAGEMTTQKSILSVLIPGAVGYYLPKYWVQRRVQTREEEITSGFPDALDLMLVCVEAGQSLDQAIIRVAKEIRSSYESLADEFEIVAYEMKAGKDKTKVLRDFGERCGVQDVNSFVTVLIQSATFGTSIAEALRVYAEEMRDKRVMRAEEKANKLPTKLTLATMMFCVPPLLIILIGPSVYGISQNLGGQ
ncbi:type II secretion system F family protein [Alterinioella nitratireducens]|uniref:type II secretion system F family protein n=1 Tax=Alterinioella nitratireducens TaxID=2735915 RepID=UPI000C3767BB|nr:type II secretion system F family protein [Alterinioella nitratireducens]MAX74899.1 pilus assembly protein TadC [Nioella sp.]NPD19504.1 type II secretion system F family protein [Alterinioella nitratireducens]|tara:strand:- start:1509 stop:2462 length:954 start_codon:yes stop_codon:yes gene_type:complete